MSAEKTQGKTEIFYESQEGVLENLNNIAQLRAISCVGTIHLKEKVTGSDDVPIRIHPKSQDNETSEVFASKKHTRVLSVG